MVDKVREQGERLRRLQEQIDRHLKRTSAKR